MNALPLISIVVPCFNEEESLGELYRRIDEASKQLSGWTREIVLIDDGSTDCTRQKIRELSDVDAGIVGVFLSRNHGHQLALTAGLELARGDRILILDADLQDPPELLPEMMAMMDDGVQVVYGQRDERKGETVFKKVTARLFYRLLNFLSEIEIPRDTGDFRLMSRQALDELNKMGERHRFIRGLVSWVGMRQEPIRYSRDPRFAGETKYPLRKMIRFSMDAVTSFSIRPLKVAILCGFLFAVLAFFFIAYVIVGTLMGHTVPGWSSIVGAILLCSSVQLFVMGVIGEYLGRLYLEAKKRPLFIVEEVIGRSEV